MTITDSRVVSNTAASGGGLYNTGSLTLNGSFVAENYASHHGGGIDSFGSPTTLTLIDSTIFDNSASTSDNTYDSGGGIYAGGGQGTVTVTDSTIANNTSWLVGGIDSGSGISLTLSDSTISGNQELTAGVANADGVYFAGTLYLLNTIIAGNNISDISTAHSPPSTTWAIT